MDRSYYLQLDENERNRRINLAHVAKGEKKEEARKVAKGEQKVGDNIRVCKVPEFFSHFAIDSSQDFGISFRHLYTMQLDSVAGYFNDADYTHYHNLGKQILLDLPRLLENPEIVINSQERSFKDTEHTISLACVLNRNIKTQTKNGVVNRPLIAFIEPNLTNEKSTVILTAYSKEKYKEFLWENFKNGNFLYVKNEKTLKRDCPEIFVTNTATVFFNGSFDTSSIEKYCEKVNIKRMEYPEKNKRLGLADIPKEQRTAKVCNAAFKQDKNTIVYFPEKLKTVDKYAEIIETLNKGLISLVPDKCFGAACEKYMKTTHNFKNDPEKLYKDLNKILTNSQRELLKQHIALEDELEKEYSAALTDEDVKEKFIEWYKENPNQGNTKTHKMVLDSKENLQQFDTDKNTVNTLVDLIQKSGIPCHTDRDEFFRVKKLIEESKEDADYMTLRQAVAGIALGISLAMTAVPAYANERKLLDLTQITHEVTSNDIQRAQQTADLGRPYLNSMEMVIGRNQAEEFFQLNDIVNEVFKDIPEDERPDMKKARAYAARIIHDQIKKNAENPNYKDCVKIKSKYGETYYVSFYDDKEHTIGKVHQLIAEDALDYLQEVANEYTQNLSESPQFQIEGGVTFGYVYKGEMYLNPDLMNTNTICHEYTHLWDEHIRITNPDLCKKGIDLYKNTTLWKDSEKTIWEQVESDEFYKNKWETKSREPDANGISNYDQAIFSECHARAVGKFGAEVLRRIREEDGIDIADTVIDWNKEASDYLAKEFGVEFADDDLARDFFAKPMQDLFSHKEILRELDAENLSAQFQTEKENTNQKERTNMATVTNSKNKSVHYRNSNGFEKTEIYDEQGKLVSYKDSKGTEWQREFEYDEKGNIIHYKSSRGDEWWKKYDEQGNEIYFENSDGFKEWKKYDEHGNLTYSRNSDGEKTWHKYDEHGNEVYSKDSNGKKWSCKYEYDEKGNVTHFKNSGGYEEWKEYDEKGNLTYSKNSHGFEEWREYDEKANLTYSKASDGTEEWNEYDEKGNVTHYKKSDGKEWWKEYDEHGNELHYKKSDGYEERKKYDDEGNLIHLKDSDGFEEWNEIEDKTKEIEKNISEIQKEKTMKNTTLTEINETNITRDFLTEINDTYLEKILGDENSEAREYFADNTFLVGFQDLAKNKTK